MQLLTFHSHVLYSITLWRIINALHKFVYAHQEFLVSDFSHSPAKISLFRSNNVPCCPVSRPHSALLFTLVPFPLFSVLFIRSLCCVFLFCSTLFCSLWVLLLFIYFIICKLVVETTCIRSFPLSLSHSFAFIFYFCRHAWMRRWEINLAFFIVSLVLLRILFYLYRYNFFYYSNKLGSVGHTPLWGLWYSLVNKF